MNNHYFRTGLTCMTMGMAMAASAVVTPKVKPETPVNGGKYVLVNQAQTESQYMSRTSWDGALYFLGETDSKYADYAFTALDNGDGTWSFALPTVNAVIDPETGEDTGETEIVNYYMLLPDGSANVNANSTEPAKWILDAKENNFFNLILGEGNNSSALAMAEFTPTKDIRIHLNAGSQYVCATYLNGPWYPDCLGGINETEDEQSGNIYFAASDSTSFKWGFVPVEKIPAYMANVKVVKTINDFENNYADIEGYEAGFKLTIDAATAIYNADNYNENEEDEAAIIDMLNSKKQLYNEILNAEALNTDGDAVLAAAIESAKSIFTQTTDANAIAQAIADLKKAQVNYSLGNGDVTALGTNMSFEDLSAQNGATTTGIAGAPIGWNIYVNGNKVTTADEVKAAGIANWHGVNADCTGDIKDGNYGFGLWTSSVPEYEISQTISGLENGTYIVTAGLMVGANGNGSRRTTQRIFANLSSTYYGTSEDYNHNLLDNSEAYNFAGLTEENTDTELKPVSVRAFVYDGTLTFGLRTDGNIAAAFRDNGNSSGGDGWFKLDNFTIQKAGYDADDVYSLLNHYVGVLEDYDNEGAFMAAEVKKQLNDNIEKFTKLNASNTQEELINGILEAKNLLATVDNSVKLYQKLYDAIAAHSLNVENYTNKTGIGEYTDAIYEAQEAYEDGTAADEAAINAIIAALDEALQQCIQSDAIEEGANLTEYIKNASFEDLSNQNNSNSSGVAATPKGWDMYINGTQVTTVSEINAQGVTGWCAINEGDAINVDLEDGSTVFNQYSDGSHLWGIWNGTIPEIELSQVVTGLPAGRYTLTCDVLVQYNWAGNCITTQRIFANDYVAMYSTEDAYENNLPEDAKIAAEIDALTPDASYKHLTYAGYLCESPRSDYSHTVSLTFGLAENGSAKIGFRTNNITSDGNAANNGLGWFKLDNWTLTYDAIAVPEGADVDASATGIETAGNAEVKTATFFTIDGRRLSAPRKGINVIRMSDGTVEKVIVK